MADRAHGDGRGSPASALERQDVLVLAAFVLLIGTQFLIPRKAGRAGPSDRAGAAHLKHAQGYEQDNPKTAYEHADWPLGIVGLAFLAALALLVVSPLVLMAAYPMTLPDVARTLRIAPPGPRLQTNPPASLAQFRAEEAKRLDTYYWIDKQKGIVHIPIDQAMKNVVRNGVPGFPKGQQ